MATLQAYIISWILQINWPQRKIEATKKEKVQIDASSFSSIKEKLVEEANDVIEHTEISHDLEQKVSKIKVDHITNDMRIRCARLCFEQMKKELKS